LPLFLLLCLGITSGPVNLGQAKTDFLIMTAEIIIANKFLENIEIATNFVYPVKKDLNEIFSVWMVMPSFSFQVMEPLNRRHNTV